MKALPLLLCCGLVQAASAAPIVRISLGKTSQAANTSLSPGDAITTSARSYSELATDRATVRLGSNSKLRSSGDRLQLDQGLALVASKPKFFRPSVKVSTPRHNLEVKGTAQVFHGKDDTLRVVVLEGKLSLSLHSMSGERITLRAGQAVIVKPVQTSQPQVLQIDLDRLMASAELVAGRQFDDLPTADLMEEASDRQTRDNERQRESSSSAAADVEEAEEGADEGSDEAGVDSRVEDLTQDAAEEDIDDLDGDGLDDSNDPDFAEDPADEGDPDEGDDTPDDGDDAPDDDGGDNPPDDGGEPAP
jgi:hypothetical protein